MIYSTQADTHSLYIHWPFCPYKCTFCPFVAIAGRDEYMEQYHVALKQELIRWAKSAEKKINLNTIFIGGGTPSTYPKELILDMFDTLKGVCTIAPDAEISIEVNPGTVKEGIVQVWQRCGINRLSIGVQGLKDTALHALNRLQSAHDVRSLLVRASEHMNNMSVDLILGLPGVTVDEWKATIAEVVTWPIKHVSVYFLTIHENTPLYFRVAQKQVALAEDDEMVKLYHWTVDALERAGLHRYELSNFARDGYECRHNMGYWKRSVYKGIGLGACSFDGEYRFTNEKSLLKYIAAIEKNEDPVCIAEKMTDEQIRMETLMLALRTREGMTQEQLLHGLDAAAQEQCQRTLERLVQEGFIEQLDGHVRLTSQGLVLENEILVQLMG